MANVTWSTTDKSAGVTLTGSNLIATASAVAGYVRATDRQATGKWYWEVRGTTWASGNTGIGVGPAGITPVGATPFDIAVVYRTGQIWLDNINTGFTLGTRANNDIIGVALDIAASLVWFRVAPSGNWNGIATANPATGAGGLRLSEILGGLAIYPLVALGANDSVTANFGDTAFSGSVPSGFTSGFTAGAALSTNAVLGGMAREALVSDIGQLQVGGLAREALVSGVYIQPYYSQYAVTVLLVNAANADPYFANVSLLCGFDGATTDESSYHHTMTLRGNAALDTVNVKYGTGAITMDGAGDRVDTPAASELAFGNSNFTVEGWFRFVGKTDNQALLGVWGSTAASCSWYLYITGGTLQFSMYAANVRYNYNAAFVPTLGQWYHLAVSRSATSLKIFVNGNAISTTAEAPRTMHAATVTLAVGTIGVTGAFPAYDYQGQMDEIRITLGVARYIENFPPPTAKFLRS